MSNWGFLNEHRLRFSLFASRTSDGFNGAFEFALPGEARRVRCIASDGMGWQHVSVSFGRNTKTPSWEVMSQVKDLFWNEDEVVIQIHPSKSDHVNNHPGCLHLWRCTDGREQPLPESILVGIKALGVIA